MMRGLRRACYERLPGKLGSWIMLGAWYQSFAQANAQFSELAAAVATPVPPTDLSNLPYPQLYQSVKASFRQQIQQDASTSLAPRHRSQLPSTLCNSAFSLIHVIPDNVLSWIGGQMARSSSAFEDNVQHGFDGNLGRGEGDARLLSPRSGGSLGASGTPGAAPGGRLAPSRGTNG